VRVTDNYVPPASQPPIANAGTDKTVNAGDNVTLDGSYSKDPDGSIKSYSWMQTSGPAVTLGGSNTSSPTFTAPNVRSDTALKFSLTVKDDNGATSNPVIVTVTVKSSTPPLGAGVTTPGNLTNTTGKLATADGVLNEYVFVKKWGSSIGQFSRPWD